MAFTLPSICLFCDLMPWRLLCDPRYLVLPLLDNSSHTRCCFLTSTCKGHNAFANVLIWKTLFFFIMKHNENKVTKGISNLHYCNRMVYHFRLDYYSEQDRRMYPSFQPFFFLKFQKETGIKVLRYLFRTCLFPDATLLRIFMSNLCMCITQKHRNIRSDNDPSSFCAVDSEPPSFPYWISKLVTAPTS